MAGTDQPFQIEKEYDARYEGLDFDDVDERPLQLLESQEEDATLPDTNSPPPPLSQKTEQDIDGTFETLERAEALEEQIHAQKHPKNRIIDRLEGNTNTGPTTGGAGGTATSGVAAPLASSQPKLADALAANSDLASSIKNPFSFVAALTLELIPQGTLKTTALSKLASALRCLKTATSQEELIKSIGLPPETILNAETTRIEGNSLNKDEFKRISLEIKRVFELAEECKAETTTSSTSQQQQEEQTVRALLKLATAPVTGNMLQQCDQAGKKMRKLKNHPVQAVAQASEAVVKGWKQTLS